MTTFQFYDSTIKRKTTVYMRGKEQHFNSTIVRLKESLRIDPVCLERNFNSTIVRLKALIAYASYLLPTSFQFYDSTIKSCATCRCASTGRNFNSTIVRLKARVQDSVTIPGTHFNSTIVRLKACSRLTLPRGISPFQFYDSTIKRPESHETPLDFDISILR